MDDRRKQKLPICVIFRVINKINEITGNNIDILKEKVNQILILFSGSEDVYTYLKQKYNSFTNIEVYWTYNFSYPEPVINGILNEVKSEWILHLFDRDKLSGKLIESLESLISQEVEGYMIRRDVDDFKTRKNIPLWLDSFLRKGFNKKFSFVPILYKREAIEISDILHTQYKIHGKILYLNDKDYYVTQVYNSRDTQNDSNFINHWIEKEKRYIFIELFITRKSRAAALSKIMSSIPINQKFKMNPIKLSSKFFNSELTYFEYKIFEFIKSLSWGKIGLSPYQKIKIETIKQTRDINSIGFFISEDLRINKRKIIELLNLKSSIVAIDREEFKDLINPQNTEVTFITHLLNSVNKSIFSGSTVDVIEIIQRTQEVLSEKMKKYMPVGDLEADL